MNTFSYALVGAIHIYISVCVPKWFVSHTKYFAKPNILPQCTFWCNFYEKLPVEKYIMHGNKLNFNS
jgi:hypothetical protein